MRILILSTNVVCWGGSEELWLKIAYNAIDQGHEVMISVFMHKPLHEKIISLSKHGAVIHKRPFPSYFKGQRFAGRILAEIKLRTRLENSALDWLKVKQWQPESVLISSGETFDFTISDQSFIIRYCQTKKVPYHLISQFNWEHDMDVSLAFRHSRKALTENSAGHFFVSYRNYKNAEMQLAAHLNHARIICNPIKMENNTVIPYPKRKKMKLATVARYQPYIKGQDLLLQALSDKTFNDVDFELSLYGSGDEQKHLENLISFYGLDNKVFIKGFLEDIREVWIENQILILTGRAEGTPLALLEAMHCGRTAIVTNVGDSALWVGARGFVAESNAIESLVKILKDAFAKKENWEELGFKSREFVLTNHIQNQDEQIVDCLTSKIELSCVGNSPQDYRALFEN